MVTRNRCFILGTFARLGYYAKLPLLLILGLVVLIAGLYRRWRGCDGEGPADNTDPHLVGTFGQFWYENYGAERTTRVDRGNSLIVKGNADALA